MMRGTPPRHVRRLERVPGLHPQKSPRVSLRRTLATSSSSSSPAIFTAMIATTPMTTTNSNVRMHLSVASPRVRSLMTFMLFLSEKWISSRSSTTFSICSV